MSRATANIAGMSPVIPPAAFLPMASWDTSGGDRMQGPPASAVHDPLSAFLACQSQVGKQIYLFIIFIQFKFTLVKLFFYFFIFKIFYF